jgi:hypothetical protein
VAQFPAAPIRKEIEDIFGILNRVSLTTTLVPIFYEFEAIGMDYGGVG